MTALAGRIPRALKNHRTPEGALYGSYLRAKLKRLGPLPVDARPLLREAGLIMLDLERLREEQRRALERRYLTVARRIDRRLVPLRTQLLTIEARLEEMAGRLPRVPASPLELLDQLASRRVVHGGGAVPHRGVGDD